MNTDLIEQEETFKKKLEQLEKNKDYSSGKLLTKKELAERWQVSEKAIDNWRKDGIITQCKGVPAIRFSLQHVMELEGTRIEKFSPLERRTLERELEKVTQERDLLITIVSNNLAECSKVINLIKEGGQA